MIVCTEVYRKNKAHDIIHENGCLQSAQPETDLIREHKMAKYEAVLFDLDGTLTDSGPAIMNSVQYAMRKMGRAPLPEDTLRRTVGPSLLYSFTTYAGMSEEEAWRAVDYYRELYNNGEAYNVTIYDGIPELLERLNAAGIRCAVATSKPLVMSQKILAHFDLMKYFAAVAGPDPDDPSNQKSILIHRALDRLGVNSRDAVMIGDTRFDIIGAKEAGCGFIGVTYGYGTWQELEENGADCLAGSAQELEKILLPRIQTSSS